MASPRFAPTLNPREPLQAGFLRLLHGFESEARRLTRVSAHNYPTVIHDTRVLIKRLRTLLWLVQPALAPTTRTQSKRHLRQAAELLAKPRDLDVTEETLKALARKISDADDRRALSAIRRTLRPAEAFSPATLVRRTLALVNAELSPLREHAKMAKHWPQLSDRLDKSLRQFHHARKKARRANKSIPHHEWRKKTKRLLYLLEIIHPQPDKPVAHLIQCLDKLQDTLGKGHDCAITRDHLPKKATRIHHLLHHREKHFQKKAAHQARHLTHFE